MVIWSWRRPLLISPSDFFKLGGQNVRSNVDCSVCICVLSVLWKKRKISMVKVWNNLGIMEQTHLYECLCLYVILKSFKETWS